MSLKLGADIQPESKMEFRQLVMQFTVKKKKKKTHTVYHRGMFLLC